MQLEHEVAVVRELWGQILEMMPRSQLVQVLWKDNKSGWLGGSNLCVNF
jgi:hypothetical protein